MYRVFIKLLAMVEATTSGGLRQSDEASYILQNLSFEIAFVTNRVLFFTIVSRFQFLMETFNNMNH
jgi:hypothetical protein